MDALRLRHESLRTRFISKTGVPQQVVDPPDWQALEVIDLSGMPAARRQIEMVELAQGFACTEIDLAVGPILDAKLVRLSSTNHVLLVGVDHMVSDAASCSIISRDLWSLYGEVVGEAATSLPPLRVQFPDYAVWQQDSGEGWLAEHAHYWRARLANVQRIDLPQDAVAAVPDGTTGPPLRFLFGEDLSRRMRQAAARERTLLSLFVLTAYVAAMWRWCGQSPLLLESLSHGRHGNPDLQNMVGFLASRVYLHLEVQPHDTMIDLLKRVTEEFYQAYRHHDHGRIPDFLPGCQAQLYFNWLPSNWSRNGSRKHAITAGGCVVEQFDMPAARNHVNPSSTFQLNLSFTEGEDGIELTVGYTPENCPVRAIERFAANLHLILDAFVRSPRSRVDGISLD